MATTSTIVGSGTYTYEVNEDWARLPDGWTMPAASVTVDSEDRVYCFNRSPEHPVVVFDREGNYLHSWGAGQFAFPHTIRADERDNLWLVDREHGQMLYFTRTGELLRTIGTRGYRSDTGVDPSDTSSSAYKSVTHGGGPFNLPTDIALTPGGEMFVTACLTACGSTDTGACSCATVRTTACRCSTRQASSCASGPRS